MGIIQTQTIKNLLVNYAGAFVGGLSTLLIYPLDPSIYGHALFLYSSAFFLTPFASLGINASVIKFFPRFKTEDGGDHGFQGLTLMIAFFGFLLFSLLVYFTQDHFFKLMQSLNFTQGPLEENFIYIIFLALLLILVNNISAHIINTKSTAFPNVVVNLGYKFFLPLIVYLSFIKSLNQEWFSTSILLFHLAAICVLVFFLGLKKRLNLVPDFKFLTKSLKKEMTEYTAFSSLNSIGNTMVNRIDVIMLALLLGYGSTGKYGIFLVLATLIDLPLKALYRISSPVISDAFEKNDLSEINTIYKKSSINLGIAGLYLFGGIWLCIDEVVELTTNTAQLRPFIFVFLFLGLGKIVDMLASVNTHIIIYSKYFRYNLVFIFLMGILTVITNYIFINSHGVVGAAMATAIVLLIYNTIKLIFIWFKMGYHPFSIQTVLLLMIFGIAYYISSLLFVDFHPILNILIKGSVFSILYLLPIWYLTISSDINTLIKSKLKI